MSYTYLENRELKEALESYRKRLTDKGMTLGSETVSVTDALDRITSEAVYARISAPHYNASAMDGIAVLAAQTFGATDTTPVVLKKGTDFQVVDTGDPLPEGCDAVIMVEDVIQTSEDEVRILSAASPWQHIRQIGEDLCQEEMVVPSNTRIEPATMGAMLAGCVGEVAVWKRPVIGLIPTGDEIVSPRANPKEGEIIEFNTTIFSAMVRRWGAVPKTYPIVVDKFDLILETLKKASEECDMVILNAGSSAGREDFSSRAIGTLGEVFLHGIAIKPGKPTILGEISGKPCIGVPGYPVSGIIVLEKIGKGVLEGMMMSPLRENPKVRATVSRRVMSTLKYEEFVRIKLGRVNGRLIATPLNRGAGVVTSFVKADALLTIPMNTEGIEAGDEVEVELLKTEKEIDNTLVVIGSHDPLIDVAYDLMRRNYPEEYVSSAHVGSMGGIMAMKRGEAHIAGIHLLDETTGEYNTSYIEKYLKGKGIHVIRGVRRMQGLMVAPGNPLGIRDIGDIAMENLRYVNRQKGSGTRILLDYLLKGKGVDREKIYGYDREEFTHMSVAVQVATGTADCGMGIYSAAKVYGLEFIPVCEEEYDFIVSKEALETDLVKDFVRILESPAFESKLMELGGYRLVDTGKIVEMADTV
ncbi:MAG TPA: molybdopterin biosynthesis protein [Clostridiaceae bacterium]|nr:molybdopterin biosynthesis protein [Clostridiaceae bacterium]